MSDSEVYDETIAAVMREWSALVSAEDRARLLVVVNQFNQLPATSRRVAAAMVSAIELIARPAVQEAVEAALREQPDVR